MCPETRPFRRVAAKSVCRKRSAAAELGDAQADGVAVRGFGQPAQGDPPHLGKFVVHGPMVVQLSPHHVRIEARAADVLAEPVDQQHVDARKRQPRQPMPGQHEQFFLAGLELLGPDGLDPGRLVVSVLDDGQPGQDVAASHYFGGHAANDPVEAEVADRAVIDRCPRAVAQADQQHFHQAAFDRADERGVRLDAIADQNMVGLEGQAVEMDRETLRRPADNHRFHVRADRATDGSFGNAVGLDEPPLAFGRSAAVAAHGRHDEWAGAEAPEVLDDRPHHENDVGDAAAAGRNGHGLAWPNRLAQVEPRQLGMDLGGHVVDPRGVEGLANAEDLRK